MPDQQDTGQSDSHHDETWPGTASAYSAWPQESRPLVEENMAGLPIPLPREQLDPRARTIWFINNLIATTVITLAAIGVMVGIHRWRDPGMLWVVGIPVVVLLVLVVASWLDALVRYRQWRFEIREDEVDLKHGFVTHTRQLVPMSRIQHVDTRQGPIERHYGLSSVIFYTAAGSMEIPALAVARAGDVRNQIAALAKVHDDL